MSSSRGAPRSSEVHYVPVAQSEELRTTSQATMDTDPSQQTVKAEKSGSPVRLRPEARSPNRQITSKLMQAYHMVRKPPGFLKLLQCLLAVMAFSAAASSPHLISIFCKDNVGTYVKYSYPYKMSRTSIKACGNKCFMTTGDRCSGAAHFFVFVGVISLLISPGLFIAQAVISDSSKHAERSRLIDLGVSAGMAIAWFAASCAWAAAVSEIRQLTHVAYIAGLLQAQTKFTGCEIFPASNASLVISVLLGFCNFGLWAAACYFILKETNYFKRHRHPQELHTMNVEAATGPTARTTR